MTPDACTQTLHLGPRVITCTITGQHRLHLATITARTGDWDDVTVDVTWVLPVRAVGEAVA